MTDPDKAARFLVDRMTTELFSEIMVREPLVALTTNSFRDLLTELGDERATMTYTMTYLIDESTKHAKPIAINLEDKSGSKTIFIAPRDWSEERLSGWVATAKPALERHFGDVEGPAINPKKTGRNDPCWCGSGKKFKRCHGTDSQ